MSGEKDGGTGLGSVKARQNIFRRGAGSVFVTRETGLDLGLVAERGKFSEDAFADNIVRGASSRMRNAVADQAPKHGTRATGGKFRGGDRGLLGLGGTAAGHRKKKNCNQDYCARQ